MNFIPMTEQQIKEFNRLTIPNEQARAGWRLDRKKILLLMDVMGIERPVKFRLMKGKYTHGSHRVGTDTHRITLNQGLPANEINEVIIHELRHAWQAENWARKTGKPIERFYRLEVYPHGYFGSLNYEKNPYEIDCNKFARSLGKEWWLLDVH